jgi:membrane protease YdiL (CAAX protease family)
VNNPHTRRQVACLGVTGETGGWFRRWLAPARPYPAPELPRRERRLQVAELCVVFAITLALSGLRSGLSLIQSLLRPGPLSDQHVALNAPAALNQYVDLALQLAAIIQLVGWGALGVYLLVRAGMTAADIGLDGSQPGRDAARAVGLALLIGLPGLGLYLVSRALGVNLTVQPSTLTETWWRLPVLIASAVGNAWAEEVLLTGYLLSRLRRLGWSENRSVALSAVVRGCYHLYQGAGGAVGNLVMGLVFARVWQRTGRLWALVGAHSLLDIVAFVGYALLHGRVTWLP